MKRIGVIAIVGVVLQVLAIMLIGCLHFFKGIGFLELRPNLINCFTYAALVLKFVGWILIARFFWMLAKEAKPMPCCMAWVKAVKEFVCCLAYPFIVLFCGWEFCRYFVLEWAIKNKDVLLGMGVEKVISATVWPALILLLVFLFRKQLFLLLAELPGLIKRSRYDNRTTIVQPTITNGEGKQGVSEKIAREVASSTDVTSEANVTSANSSDANFEEAALNKLAEEFWPFELKREACIDNSKFRFDAAVNRDGWIYGIETKCANSFAALERSIFSIVNRLDGLYAEFSEYTKGHFIFLLCLYSDDSNNGVAPKIKPIFEGKPYRCDIRICDKNGEKIDPSFRV